MKKKIPNNERLIVALDVPSIAQALKWVRKLRGQVKNFKVGSELFTAEGPEVVKKINALGCRVFLDLKFFDITNTMVSALKSAAKLKPFLINVHALAGPDALRNCAGVFAKAKSADLIAVTILTSFTQRELKRAGMETPLEKTVLKLCKNALDCGLSGVVASPSEVVKLRKKFGENFLIVTPGIRPSGTLKDDQKRVATPFQAIKNGADYIVVGRPILTSTNPVKAVREIMEEIEKARQ